MLNTHESSKSKLWKYSLIVPFLVAFIFLFQIETVAQVKEPQEAKEKEYTYTSIYSSILTSKSSDKELKELEKTFSDEKTTLNISKVKRNKENEITAIKLSFDTGKTYNSVYERKSTVPIDPIKIFVDVDKNDNKIVGFKEIKRNLKTDNEDIVIEEDTNTSKNENHYEIQTVTIHSNNELPEPPTPPSPPSKAFERLGKTPTPPKFPEAPMVPSNLQDEKEMKKFEEKMAVFEMKIKKMEPQIAQFEKEMEEYEKEMQGFEPDMKVFEKQMEEFEKQMEAYQEQIIQNTNIIIDKRTERREEINQEQDREIKIARLRAEENQKAREEAHKAAIKSKIAAEEAKVQAERAKRKAEIEKRIAEEQKRKTATKKE